MESISRRQALTIAAATCAACACADAADPSAPGGGGGGGNNQPKGPPPKEVKIGKLADYSKDGFYDKYVSPGQIIVGRVDGKLVAMTARCTHKNCILKLKPNADTASKDPPAMLKCNCHQAEFAQYGQPVKGPAKVALSRFALKAGDDGVIVVDTTKSFEEKKWDDAGAFIEIPKA